MLKGAEGRGVADQTVLEAGLPASLSFAKAREDERFFFSFCLPIFLSAVFCACFKSGKVFLTRISQNRR